MSSIDFSQYNDVDQIITDIKSIKIQGATNVAISTFEGMKLFINAYSGADLSSFLREVIEVGNNLATARPNEPLATNGVRYVNYKLKLNGSKIADVNLAKSEASRYCDEYLDLIKGAKDEIVKHSTEVSEGVDEILTNLH